MTINHFYLPINNVIHRVWLGRRDFLRLSVSAMVWVRESESVYLTLKASSPTNSPYQFVILHRWYNYPDRLKLARSLMSYLRATQSNFKINYIINPSQVCSEISLQEVRGSNNSPSCWVIGWVSPFHKCCQWLGRILPFRDNFCDSQNWIKIPLGGTVIMTSSHCYSGAVVSFLSPGPLTKKLL